MITDLLSQRASATPGKAFIITPEGDYSFSRIDTAALRFASRLAELGVNEGDHVALIADNCAAFLVAWFAISYRGAVAVTLNNQLVADGLRYSVDQCDAKLLIADRAWVDARAQHLDARQAALPRVVIESDADFFQSLEGLAPAAPVHVAAERPCSILYTSGTTGLPKGVVNCHNAYRAAGVATAHALKLTEEDRIMVYLPLFHVNPQMYGVMSALVTGAAIILLRRFSAASFFDDAIRFGATGCTFVGTVLSILVGRHTAERRDHAMRFCFGGGAPREIWTTVESRYGIKVHEAYGMTETGGWSSANTVDDSRFGSCGRPRPDLEIRIFDKDDNEAAPGQQGEIVVRPKAADVMLLGYYRKPEQMLEASRNFWFHTGDLGSFDADGYLVYHGRLKELIRRSGEMISPVEIETCLRRMPGVRDCAVVAVPDAIVGDEIKAVLVCDVLVEPLAVRTFLKDLLPAYMLPRFVEFLEAIPKTETEKIQRNKLQYVNDTVHDLSARPR
jgi:crotonobetaine/carnitine-CoA ligase